MNDKNPLSREEQLLKSAAQQVDASPSFKYELEKKLMNAHKPKTGFGLFSVKKIAFTAGWTVAIAALILTFIWVIRSIAPQPQPQPAAGDTPFPNVETAPESSAPQKLIDYAVKEGDTCAFIAGKYDTTVEEIMKHNNLTGACRIMIDQVLKIPVKADSANLPQGETYETSMGQFIMTVGLPDAVPQATLYQLDPAQENEKYKVVKILELAARVGMNGTLYRLSEKNGGPGLIYTDGKQRIEVNNYALHQFSYYPDYITYPLISNQGNALLPAEMSAKAEEFLKARKLLDFPYQVEHPTDANSRMVTFVPRLNDLTDSSYIFPNFATLQVSFDKNGEIATVDWKVQPWEAKGSYPLISAQQAWDKFLTNELNGLGVEMTSGGYSPSPSSSTFKLWQRDIPLDQPTSLIGIVTSSDAVDGGTPLLIMDNISLTGNLEGLTNPDETVQLDGQYIMDGDVKKFQVESWKTVDPIPTLDGTLEQADGQNWLVTTDGQRLQMEDLPEDVQVGERTFVFGIVSDGKVDWKTISQGEGGGGGGGGGGGAGLARLNLSGTPMPTATPLPISTPVDYRPLIGTKLDGERGIVDVWNLQAKDGSTYFVYKLSSDSETGFLNSLWQATLEGPATEGLKAYYRLPVKIWGTITSISPPGIPTIQLDRYEPLYPDEKAQIWFGEEKVTQVEGKDVLLFTANDGTSYVRNDSIENGMVEPTVAEKGLIFFVVGWSIPDQTFGGYPVLNVMSIGTVPQDYDFNSIISDALTPPIMGEANMNFSGETPTGIINRVELVYLGEDQLLAQVEERRVLYAQPFWRFSGYYNESSYFDIIVQALPDEYLQPVPLQ